MFLVGAVMDFGSLGLLPASLALPLGGVGLAASSFFATRFVGESFTRRDKIGTTLISMLNLERLMRFIAVSLCLVKREFFWKPFSHDSRRSCRILERSAVCN